MPSDDESHFVAVSVPPSGRIDIHSHLLPALDDGCRDVEESFEEVRRLIAAGFVGSICTPHFLPFESDCPSVDHVLARVIAFSQQLRDAGLSYSVWPGGELRLYDGLIPWLGSHGVPTLAGSRCVLVDFWEARWPRWATEAFDWLLNKGYQPILAHPERLACTRELDEQLDRITRMGVWLQGNFRCMTGEEGYEPDRWVRKLLRDDRYRFMALDMHRPDTLDARLDGLRMVEQEFGPATVDRLTTQAPRQWIFSTGSVSCDAR